MKKAFTKWSAAAAGVQKKIGAKKSKIAAVLAAATVPQMSPPPPPQSEAFALDSSGPNMGDDMTSRYGPALSYIHV
jgi:hypothetical protein